MRTGIVPRKQENAAIGSLELSYMLRIFVVNSG